MTKYSQVLPPIPSDTDVIHFTIAIITLENNNLLIRSKKNKRFCCFTFIYSFSAPFPFFRSFRLTTVPTYLKNLEHFLHGRSTWGTTAGTRTQELASSIESSERLERPPESGLRLEASWRARRKFRARTSCSAARSGVREPCFGASPGRGSRSCCRRRRGVGAAPGNAGGAPESARRRRGVWRAGEWGETRAEERRRPPAETSRVGVRVPQAAEPGRPSGWGNWGARGQGINQIVLSSERGKCLARRRSRGRERMELGMLSGKGPRWLGLKAGERSFRSVRSFILWVLRKHFLNDSN